MPKFDPDRPFNDLPPPPDPGDLETRRVLKTKKKGQVRFLADTDEVRARQASLAHFPTGAFHFPARRKRGGATRLRRSVHHSSLPASECQ